MLSQEESGAPTTLAIQSSESATLPMSPRLQRLSLPILAAALLLAPAAAAQELRASRPVDVPEAGWVRMPLDPEIVRSAAETGGGLQLFAPDGEEVAFARLRSEAQGEAVTVEVVSVTEAPGGWLVTLALAELGERRHDRLDLILAGDRAAGPAREIETEAGSFRLEGSAGGASWELLTVAGRGAMDGTAAPADGERAGGLSYPATGFRRLRLWWPADAGPPRIEAARARTVPVRSVEVAVSRPACRRNDTEGAGPRAVCPIPLGSVTGLLERLDVVLAARGTVGYRLHAAREGRWEVVSAGVWPSPLPETPHSLGLRLELPEPAEPLRLDLYGGGEETPDLAEASATLGAESVVFRARRPGRHTLAYGPGVYGSSEQVAIPDDIAPIRVEAGAEEAGGASGGGAPLPGSAGPEPAVRFDRAWPVRAEAPAAGVLHRLAVEDGVYGVARRDLRDVRLLAGELQVPFVRWRPAEPAAVAATQQVEPPQAGEGLRVELDLEVARLPLSALVIHAPAERFRRRVRLLSEQPRAPGEEESLPPLTPWLDWSCTPEPPLSCRKSIGLGAEALERPGVGPMRRLVLAVEDLSAAAGASGPGALELELWRHRDLLLFPWPEGDRAVRLVAGSPDLEAPEYDLAERRGELLARPWRGAEIAAEAGADDRGWVARITVGVTLGGALLLLLFLLHRILAAAEPAR